jgi:putative colanic acid biosynthesis acetyltransferase WcaF
MEYQKLSQFKLPKDFRGKPGWYVQLWWIVQDTLFRWSPQFMYGWRRLLLRLFGAKVGKNVIIRPTAKITYPWKVKIGDYSWIGDDVVLYSLGEIVIGDNVVIVKGHIFVQEVTIIQKQIFQYLPKRLLLKMNVG